MRENYRKEKKVGGFELRERERERERSRGKRQNIPVGDVCVMANAALVVLVKQAVRIHFQTVADWQSSKANRPSSLFAGWVMVIPLPYKFPS